MSDMITGLTRGGATWTPEFIVAINQQECIGCGRCYKVCPREVFELVEREADEDDDDDDFSDDVAMVMTVANALDCIGCGSCARVCSKKCHSHAAAALSA
jgi:Nif-specific ferredoxin III